ncbi:hypothetical protein IAT40_002322 [Kwoniella sp. CBS 6097]
MSEPTTTAPHPKPASLASSSPSLSTRSRILLARLTKLTGTLPGLDASLMLFQYSSPLVIALLLRLATLKSRYAFLRNNKGVAAAAGVGVKGGFGLVQLAEGWGKAALSVSEARVIMRAFGLLPILQWLLAIHPNPLKSLRSLLLSFGSPSSLAQPSEKTLPTLQILSLLAYYPLEHITWLSRKGVVPLSAQRTGLAELWSVRFWALYVMLEIYKLRGTYLSLLTRTKALKTSKPVVLAKEAEGYELPPSPASPGQVQEKTSPTESVGTKVEDKSRNAPVDALAVKQTVSKDWEAWKTAVMINSGYAPLTLHWSTIGGLWSSSLITGTLGSVAALGSLTNAWRATAP